MTIFGFIGTLLFLLLTSSISFWCKLDIVLFTSSDQNFYYLSIYEQSHDPSSSKHLLLKPVSLLRSLSGFLFYYSSKCHRHTFVLMTKIMSDRQNCRNCPCRACIHFKNNLPLNEGQHQKHAFNHYVQPLPV